MRGPDMVLSESQVRSALLKLTDRGSVTARLFRRHGAEGQETPTGAVVRFGQSGRAWIIQISNIVGELPANVRIEDGRILASSKEAPTAWEAVDKEGDELRILTLLDPRRLARHMERVSLQHGQRTHVVGHLDLFKWDPKLPDDLLKWLRGDAFDHVVELEFQGTRLLQITQSDLPPRQADFIVEKFSQLNLELPETAAKPSYETAEERFRIRWE